MVKFLVFAVMFLLLLPLSYSHGSTAKKKNKPATQKAPFSHGFKAKGQDCSKCHSLSKEDALLLFKDLIPNAKILAISASPVAGMWEVDVDAGGRKMPMYVDFSKKHLFSGAVIVISEKRNISQERMEELNKIVLSKNDVSQIPLGDTIVVGNKDAKHKVIVFSDPD